MKLFKYEFIENNLTIIDGEIVESDPTVYEANFSLTTRSLLMFEEEYGKPLLVAITNLAPKSENADVNVMIDEKVIRALAASCYLKIENGKVLCNETTKEEFKKSPMNELCIADITFITKMYELAMDCLYQEKVSAKNGAKQDKKK